MDYAASHTKGVTLCYLITPLRGYVVFLEFDTKAIGLRRFAAWVLGIGIYSLFRRLRRFAASYPYTMKLFYGKIDNNSVTIADDDRQHIVKVLRMRGGDRIAVTDGLGNLAHGHLILEGKKVLFEPESIERNLPAFPLYVHLAIAPTKNIDRTEFFIEKATELGVSEISFLMTEKTERKHLNIEKIQKQVIAASKQSLRFHFPKVNDPARFDHFINTVDSATTYVAHCHESLQRLPLNAIEPAERISFLVGPEGDFSTGEIELLAERNITAVSLGSQRLRTETAGVFLAAWSYNLMNG